MLKQIMAENALSPEKVAAILNKPVRTVYAWISDREGHNQRNIPQGELERLVLLLFARNTNLSPHARFVFDEAVTRATGV